MILLAIKLTIFIATGYGSPTPTEQVYVANQIKTRVSQEAGVRFKSYTIKRIRLRYAKDLTLSNIKTLAPNWWRYFKTRYRHLGKHHKKLLMLPPLQQEGKLYLAGMAYVCKDFGWFNAETYNANGEPRLEASVIGGTHELYHTLCANHENSEGSIMHENAIAEFLRLGSLYLTDNSKREIFKKGYYANTGT